MFILIFGLVLFITLEYYNIYTHQDFINTELDRNLNLTLNSSVKDSTIMSGDFEIDENKINDNINNYYSIANVHNFCIIYKNIKHE